MIKINREDTPPILQNIPRRQSYYNDLRVTSVLNIMQNSKCAYCEKNIENDFEVDHYNPKEEYSIGIVNGKKQYNWDQANRWENLLLSCRKCNRTKSSKPPFAGASRIIIDPTISDPERFIDFKVLNGQTDKIKVVVFPKNNSLIGKSTIEKLQLNLRFKDHTGPLAIRAIDFDNWFLKLIVNIRRGINENNAACQILIRDINSSMLSNYNYAGFARSFFRRRLEYFNNNERGNLENILGRVVNLNIVIPKGVLI